MADPRHTMSRKYSGAEVVQGLCFKAMRDWSYQKRTEAVIWASKHRSCLTCKSGVGQACVNLSDIRWNHKHPDKPRKVKFNKQPHAERIDWQKLLDALRQRGYSG